MKRKGVLLVFLAVIIQSGVCLAQAPRGIGGFVLGEDIAGFKDRVDMDTALPIRYAEYITEVETLDLEGFKSGIIGYGTCHMPGKILRIKLKYANGTKKFYFQLLERFKKQFGEPAEWQGDPFHVVLAWKWSFTDSGNNRISLILQHNTRDTQEKMGNAVKLTLTSQVERERACYQSATDREKGPRMKKGGKKQRGPMNWDLLIPR